MYWTRHERLQKDIEDLREDVERLRRAVVDLESRSIVPSARSRAMRPLFGPPLPFVNETLAALLTHLGLRAETLALSVGLIDASEKVEAKEPKP